MTFLFNFSRLTLQISQSPKGIFINQSKYALESLKKYGFKSCDPMDTPMVEKSKLDEDKEGKAVDPLYYRGIIGTLLYLTASRPDLQFAICMCARIKAYKLVIKRQKSAAISSTEAEYIALFGCYTQILWMRSQLTDYGLGFNKIPMYCDNKSAIAICCNNVQHSRSKHIDIRYHFIKEQVENWVIELYFVNTEYQLADLFTKALGRDRIEFLIKKLGMRSFTPETLKQLTDEVDEYWWSHGLTEMEEGVAGSEGQSGGKIGCGGQWVQTGVQGTMDTTIDQQVAMDEAFVPYAKRLRIGRSNFRLLSNIKSKESTLQLVHDVLHLTPFFKAFLVETDTQEKDKNKAKNDKTEHKMEKIEKDKVIRSRKSKPKEFWATAIDHHHAILCKMDKKKHIVNLESFRDMLHICPRLPGQSFVKPPFEEEILAFIRFLRHSAAIRKLTDVNINKLYQPWRSFAAIIKKCLIGKSSGYDSLRLSQAQILLNTKIQRRAMRCIILNSQRLSSTTMSGMTTCSPRSSWNSNAYKEYYAVATGATPPKPKASVRKTRNEGTGSIPGVLDVPTDEPEEELSWNSTDEEGDDDEGKDGDGDEEDDGDDDVADDDGEEGDDDDHQEVQRDDEEEGGDDEQDFDEEEFIHPSLSTHTEEEPRYEESFDSIPKTPKDTDDEGNGEENLSLNVGREEGHDEEEEEDELYRDININQERGIQMTQEVEDSHVTLTPVNPDGMESIFKTTSQMGAQTPTSVAPLPMSAPTITPSTIATITTTQQAPTPPTTALSTLIQDLPNFGSLFGFDNKLRTLEANFSEFMHTNQFAGAVSAITGIIQRYMDQRMNEAVKVAIQIQSDRLCDEAQKENDEFLKTIDENMQKIIKEQVKEQVKTSYVVAADLSEIELKKILIEKMEGNKSIQCSDEQRNLYKALVEAYESDKIILDTYGETVTLKRRRDDDADKDEEPSAGPDRGSKRSREGNEPESASAPKEKATRSTGKSTQGTKSRQASASEYSRGAYAYHLSDGRALTSRESARDVYSKRRIIAVTVLKIVEWHNYKHLDWITVRRDDDKLYKFKEGDFKRLRIQDIQDMLLLLVQGKQTNLTVKERFAFNISLRMFTRSIVIQRRVEDLQPGVESYQKKLNLTKPDTYRSDLKRKEAYTAYSNPKGFIYQNKDKKKSLMQIDELHKFSDGTLIDVHTALDDHKSEAAQSFPES
nr:retrotransposon protein, putative, unclassified [Tanacetum cinerariifolium]